MEKSRAEVLRSRSREPDLPEVGDFDYMVSAMVKLRPMRSTGFGVRAADWPEIQAFAELTERVQGAWEYETLADMCSAYVRELQDGDDPMRRAPIDREED